MRGGERRGCAVIAIRRRPRPAFGQHESARKNIRIALFEGAAGSHEWSSSAGAWHPFAKLNPYRVSSFSSRSLGKLTSKGFHHGATRYRRLGRCDDGNTVQHDARNAVRCLLRSGPLALLKPNGRVCRQLHTPGLRGLIDNTDNAAEPPCPTSARTRRTSSGCRLTHGFV